MTSPFDKHRKAAKEVVSRPVIWTGGSYVQAVCDAYNAASTRPDLEWYVASNGEPMLRTKLSVAMQRVKAEKARDDAERARFKRRLDEKAMAERPVAA